MRKKKYTDKSVYEGSLDRIRYLYQRFDEVVVSFSGGKDSTAVLNLTIEVAKELDRLPVKTIFFDEEAIHPPTIAYVERVRKREEVDLDWYCLPVKHRNACSNEQPFWYCWNPKKEEKWVRPMPEFAIRNHHLFKWGMTFQEFSTIMFSDIPKTFVMLDGVRTQESFRRLQTVTRAQHDNYISKIQGGNLSKARPIYDWDSEDVWRLVTEKKLDYNRTYDVFNKTRLHGKLLGQRVCPPFGEEPLRGLYLYAECFPEMWHKMLYRVPGVATAWRYSNTELYGIGKIEKPEGTSWREYLLYVLDTYEAKDRITVKKNINSLIKRHYDKTDDKISEEETHPLTGMSWKFLCKIAIKGDFKGRTAPKLENNAISVRKKMGIQSYEEAKKIYGKGRKKRKRGSAGK